MILEKCVGIAYNEINRECSICGEHTHQVMEDDINGLPGSVFLGKWKAVFMVDKNHSDYKDIPMGTYYCLCIVLTL